jgi:hypothetical protein
MTALPVVAIYDAAVDTDLEYFVMAFNKICFDFKLVINCSRQTGGFIFVPSFNTVRNFNSSRVAH